MDRAKPKSFTRIPDMRMFRKGRWLCLKDHKVRYGKDEIQETANKIYAVRSLEDIPRNLDHMSHGLPETKSQGGQYSPLALAR